MENFTLPCKSNPLIPIIPSKPDRPGKPTFTFSKKAPPLETLNLLCKNRQFTEAVAVLDSLAQTGSKVPPTTYMSLLQGCIESNSIQLGRKLHRSIGAVDGVNPFVETKLVSMYAKCGSIEDARKVFDEMRERNLYTWSAMIGACLRDRRWGEVVELFGRMVRDGVLPDWFLFPKVLQACGDCGDLEAGRMMHSQVVRCGLSGNLHVSNALLAVYAKCGELESARRFFETMEVRDGVSWNSVISGYCRKGENVEARRLIDEMMEQGIEPGLVTWNILISSFNKSGQCDVAMELMKKMENCEISADVYTWTSMISGFAQNNRTNQALDFWKKMILSGVQPNGITIASAISACTSLKSLAKGLEIYAFAVKMGLIDDVLVGNSLIDMFSKCGDLEAAEQVFDMISEKDVYTWNSMIGGYCQARYCGKAYELFMKMQESDVIPNAITYNVMITGYIQNGDADQAMDLFHFMERDGTVKRNTASWNSLIAGYAQLGEINEALRIFRKMQAFGVSPNSVTLLSILPACASLVAMKKVKEIHCSVFRRKLESEVPVANSLIDTYAKSGNLKYSRTIFDRMSSKDIITWNSAISSYVLHGHPDVALDLFDQMKTLGLKPNRGTFASILYAYSLAGMVHEGTEALSSISEEYQIIPGPEHYAAIVDLYGRSGRLQEAMGFIEDMTIELDSSVWAALLTACRNHGNLGLAIHAGEHLIDLEPGNVLIQQLMLQAYALSGKPDDTSKLRRFYKENATIKRSLGQCWMEVNNTVHTFIAGDRSKLCSKYVNLWLQDIAEKANEPDFRCGLGIAEEEEEGISMVHSEKLALAFALIGSPSIPKSIRIVKDLRICGDCHRTAKYLSAAFGCDIYLSDSMSWHHFSNGRCSCGDYW
ncbi:pentatricopeptide repeat-containing protein At1g19720 [Argentina anserina]|uniref:pentatricopeptide repeat-containing protein At1g19720 n=1 Tax=Argentina anserina TaxID=57926 RepID=UPI0021765DF9|nr:pentatricopeptide repeat-containing protein At1g19720 [Potentilla anserina]